jgi:hypothetical protein
MFSCKQLRKMHLTTDCNFTDDELDAIAVKVKNTPTANS